MSTIYDIAAKVGLSPSTVARALSGSGYCSQKSRDKVLQAAKEMRYTPVLAAKSLKNKITRKIMLCIPDIQNPYYFSLISGVNHVLEEYNYHTILTSTDHDPQRELQFMDSLGERFVDGLILGSFDLSDKLLKKIKSLDMPVVLLNQCHNPVYQNDFDSVYVDTIRAAELATLHCIEKGHRDIALLCASLKEQTGQERHTGYKQALAASGIPYNRKLVVQADHTYEGGYKAFENFLQASPAFTAVVSTNDLMGIACLNAGQEHGLSMPRNFSLITLDNTDYCLCTSPRLASIDMMQEQHGQYAAEYIMQQIVDGREFKQNMRLTPRVVPRDSVQPRPDKKNQGLPPKNPSTK